MTTPIRRGTLLAFLAITAGMSFASGAVAQTQTPQAFLDHVYDRFMRHPPKNAPDWSRGQAGEVFDPALAGLIRKYTAAADKAQSAGLDYVPFCGCNDDSGLTYVVKAQAPTGDKAAAAVTVSSKYPQQKPFVLNFDLVQTTTGWRVSDIHSKTTPSLKAQVISNLKSEYHLKP